MTCIVGVQGARVAWIGGDSAAIGGDMVFIRSDPKVFWRGPFLFGCTTSFRMRDLLAYGFSLPPPPRRGLRRYMVEAFVPALRARFEAGGFAKKDLGREEGGAFLVAAHGRLFGVDSDFQVSTHARGGYTATGSGLGCALGALHCLPRQQREAGADAVVAALAAAAAHNIYVRRPFIVRACTARKAANG